MDVSYKHTERSTVTWVCVLQYKKNSKRNTQYFSCIIIRHMTYCHCGWIAYYCQSYNRLCISFNGCLSLVS